MKIKLPNQNTVLGILALLIALSFFISEDSNLGKVLNSATNIFTQELVVDSSDKSTNTNINLQEGLVTKVVDGDTIYVVVNGKALPVRLIGVDSPESKHPTIDPECYGQEATDYLTSLILNKVVKLEADITDEDRYDRLLRHVWLGDVNINNELVKNGYAYSVEYKPDIKYQIEYDASEEVAKNNSLGVWSDACSN